MLVDVFKRAERLFRDKILLGLTDEELGVSLNFNDIVDELTNETADYGFLTNPGFSKTMDVMKAMTKHPKFKERFYVVDGKKLIFAANACMEWLKHVEEFKELLYVLIHFLAGMPKRASEEGRSKVFNTCERVRNVYNMLEKLVLVGNYSKTSAISGSDRVTLHILPGSVARLTMLFYALVFDMERRFVEAFCPNRRPNWDCYLYSSFGRPWTSQRLSKILQWWTKKYLNIAWGVAALRHLLPAIAEHYGLGISHSDESVRHHMQGHTGELAGRLYSRLIGSHPKLTNALVRETVSFCDAWHDLMGFASDKPTAMSASQMFTLTHASPIQRADSELASTVKELIGLLVDVSPKEVMIPQVIGRLENIQQAIRTPNGRSPAIGHPPAQHVHDLSSFTHTQTSLDNPTPDNIHRSWMDTANKEAELAPNSGDMPISVSNLDSKERTLTMSPVFEIHPDTGIDPALIENTDLLQPVHRNPAPLDVLSDLELEYEDHGDVELFPMGKALFYISSRLIGCPDNNANHDAGLRQKSSQSQPQDLGGLSASGQLKSTIPNETRSFTTTLSLGKTRMKARFLKNNNGTYDCICGKSVSDKESADMHLAMLSVDEIRETHSHALWKQRLKVKV